MPNQISNTPSGWLPTRQDTTKKLPHCLGARKQKYTRTVCSLVLCSMSSLIKEFWGTSELLKTFMFIWLLPLRVPEDAGLFCPCKGQPQVCGSCLLVTADEQVLAFPHDSRAGLHQGSPTEFSRTHSQASVPQSALSWARGWAWY